MADSKIVRDRAYAVSSPLEIMISNYQMQENFGETPHAACLLVLPKVRVDSRIFAGLKLMA